MLPSPCVRAMRTVVGTRGAGLAAARGEVWVACGEAEAGVEGIGAVRWAVVLEIAGDSEAPVHPEIASTAAQSTKTQSRQPAAVLEPIIGVLASALCESAG